MTKLSLVLVSCLLLPGVARADMAPASEPCVIENYNRERCEVCSDASTKNPDACKDALDATKDRMCMTHHRTNSRLVGWRGPTLALDVSWHEIWCGPPSATATTTVATEPDDPTPATASDDPAPAAPAVDTPDSDVHTRDASDPPEPDPVDAKQGCGGCASGGTTVPWSVGLLLSAAALIRRREGTP